MSDFIQGGKKLIHFDPSRVDELPAIKRIVAYSWDGLIIIPATHSPSLSLSSSRLIGRISRLCTPRPYYYQPWYNPVSINPYLFPKKNTRVNCFHHGRRL